MSAYEVTFVNVTNISFHPHSAFLTLFSSFPLNLARQGLGAKGSAGLSDSGDSGQELLLTEEQ